MTTSRIAYISTADGEMDVWTMAPDGLVAWQASFSPDASQLVFTARVGERRQLHRINADGSGLVNLSSHEADDFAAHWGPELRR